MNRKAYYFINVFIIIIMEHLHVFLTFNFTEAMDLVQISLQVGH